MDGSIHQKPWRPVGNPDAPLDPKVAAAVEHPPHGIDPYFPGHTGAEGGPSEPAEEDVVTYDGLHWYCNGEILAVGTYDEIKGKIPLDSNAWNMETGDAVLLDEAATRALERILSKKKFSSFVNISEAWKRTDVKLKERIETVVGVLRRSVVPQLTEGESHIQKISRAQDSASAARAMNDLFKWGTRNKVRFS